MPRNGSSVYSLPAGNPVIPGTVIATTWANTTLTDIATALTNSLSTDGSTASVSLSGKTMAGGTYTNPVCTTTFFLTGGQLQFPAVQVASSNVNCLDDYEEGSWTPILSWQTPGTSVITMSTNQGSYTKIGDFVLAQMVLATSTFTRNTGSGNLQITGLPFPSGGAPICTSGLIGGFNNDALAAGTNQLSVQALGGGISTLNFVSTNNTSGTATVLNSGVAGSGDGINKTIRLCIPYKVN